MVSKKRLCPSSGSILISRDTGLTWLGYVSFFSRWLTFDLRRFEYALFHRGCWVKCYAYGSISRRADQLASRPQTYRFGGLVSFLVDAGVLKEKTYIPGDSKWPFEGHLTTPKRSPAARHPKLRHIVVATTKTRWWFQICSMFSPVWGKIPSLTNMFQRVETTN